MKPPAPYRAAVVQTLAKLGDLDYNLGLVRNAVAEAAGNGARLIVFPECMNTGYLFDSAEHAVALGEPIDGTFGSELASLARTYDVFIASGMTELDGHTLFNSGVLFDRDGELVVHYHKQFLATHDQNWFAVGTRGCPVADTELGRLGLLICFDGRIPEIARALALQGADVIVDMANFFAMDQAEMWVPARAYENGVWFAAATKSGVERSINYPGGSMIVAPDGTTRAHVAYGVHDIGYAEIDVAAARDKQLRGYGDRFADRRPDAYASLIAPFAASRLSETLAEPLIPERSLMKAAAVQAHTSEASTFEDAMMMADHAAKLGVQLIVLPEYAAIATWKPDATNARQEAAHFADRVTRAATITRRYACMMVVSSIEDRDGALYPTAVLIGPDGDIIGRYRKVHLDQFERPWATAGDSFPVFTSALGNVGIMLGYDGLFPESSRVMTLEGADVIAWPCAWRHRLERTLLAVPRAADNRVYEVCANRTDAPYPGGSVAIAPGGFSLWDIDLAQPPSARHGAVFPIHANLAASRQKFMIPNVDMVRNRLTKTYDALVERSLVRT